MKKGSAMPAMRMLLLALLLPAFFSGPAHAGDRQDQSKSDQASVKAGGRSTSVATFNFGAGSAEANAVISQGYRVKDTVYISGQYSRDVNGRFVGAGDFDAQVRTTLTNIDRVLAGFKLKRSNIAEFVVYLTDPRTQSERLIPLIQNYLGDHRPAGTVLGTTGLFYPEQLIEIRVVAHAD